MSAASFWEGVSTLPSVKHGLDLVADDIATGVSVIVLLPAGVSTAWVSRAILGRRRFWSLQDVYLDRILGCSTPEFALCRFFEIEVSSIEPAQTLLALRHSAKPPEVLSIRNFDGLSSELQGEWLEFLTRWSRVAKTKSDLRSRPMAFCMVNTATATLMSLASGEVHFRVHWWWGYPSRLEMQLLVRSEHGDGAIRLKDLYRETVVCLLAGSDPDLLHALWENAPGVELDSIWASLRDFARLKGWTRELLFEHDAHTVLWSHNASLSSSLMPPARLRPLWANGALHLSAESGCLLHPAATAVITDSQHWLEATLCRIQNQVVGGWLDQQRVRLCSRIGSSHGDSWAIRYIRPRDESEAALLERSSMYCEWRHMADVLKSCNELKQYFEWYVVAKLATNIRNKLAHGSYLTFDTIEDFQLQLDGRCQASEGIFAARGTPDRKPQRLSALRNPEVRTEGSSSPASS